MKDIYKSILIFLAVLVIVAVALAIHVFVLERTSDVHGQIVAPETDQYSYWPTRIS